LATNDGGGVFVRRCYRLARRMGDGRMEGQVKSKYYRPDYRQQIESARIKLERLQLLREIADIDAKINTLDSMRALYPAQKTDNDELPCALDDPALPS
jgi:hypothetical protein